jgi:DnaJ-domain-containing protein 1
MNRGEALMILGIKEGLDPKQITLAYQKLMMRNHPDSGISPKTLGTYSFAWTF